MNVSEITQVMTGIISKRINSDRLVVPPMPEVAAKSLQILADEDFEAKKLIAVIQRDPVVSAQVLKTASSAAYGGEAIGSLEQAFNRMGARKLRAMLLEVAAYKLFQSRDHRIKDAFRKQWEHSLAVALVARDIAAVVGGVDPENAYIGGLLHDIGKPVVGALLLDAETSFPADRWLTPEQWIEVVNTCHRGVGILLAERWRLPPAIVRAIADCAEYDPEDRTSVANVVRLANSVAKAQGIYLGGYEKDDVDALVMIGRSMIGVDGTVLDRIAAGVGERLALPS